MNTENFYCCFDPESKKNGLRVAIRDREDKKEERWVFAWLEGDEVNEVYRYLKERCKEAEG